MHLTLLENARIRRSDPDAIWADEDSGRTLNWRTSLRTVESLINEEVNNHLLVPMFKLRNELIHFEADYPNFFYEGDLGGAIHWLGVFLPAELGEDLFDWAGSSEAYQILLDIEETRPLVRRAIDEASGFLAYQAMKGEGDNPMTVCPACDHENLVVAAELPLRGSVH